MRKLTVSLSHKALSLFNINILEVITSCDIHYHVEMAACWKDIFSIVIFTLLVL